MTTFVTKFLLSLYKTNDGHKLKWLFDFPVCFSGIRLVQNQLSAFYVILVHVSYVAAILFLPNFSVLYY